MNNYEAIMKMSKEQLEIFLDNVYLTGLNTGMYTSTLNEDEKLDELENNPYSIDWLNEDAEKATRLVTDDEDNDYFLPNALTRAILRCAGIDIGILDEEILDEESE